ncbi:MAG: YfhO family protein [Clostridiales bacterium]|jgi:uncharacterized membrane protein YfhO|nr:YfhO family protein [Clostridiales bacterium]
MNGLKRFFGSAIFLSYIITMGIVILVYMLAWVYPFGDRHVLFYDSFQSYAPRIAELARRLTEGGSPFYTWQAQFGVDNYLLMITSLMNPFVLLAPLFGNEYITEFFSLYYLIHIPAISAGFAYYMKKRFGRGDIVAIALSIAYGLSSFVTAYFVVFYWLPCIAMLPLVAVGVDNIIKDGKYKFYAVVLGAAIITNYLFGMFLCVFSGLYFIAELYLKESQSRAYYWKTILKYAVSSVLAVGIAGVVLVPAALLLGNTKYASAGSSIPPLEFFFSIPQVLTGYLFDVAPSVLLSNANGTPNIYVGVFALVLAVFYFVNPAIPKKQKLVYGGVLLFLILAASVNILGYVLNGMRYPTGFPHRVLFIMCFFTLFLAAQSFEKIQAVPLKSFRITTLAMLGGVVLLWIMFPAVSWSLSGYVTVAAVFENFVFILIYVALLYYASRVPERRKVLLGFVFALALVEVSTGAAKNMQIHMVETTREQYAIELNDDMEKVSELLGAEDALYRADMSPKRLSSGGSLFGYNSISSFAISYESVTEFCRNLGVGATQSRIDYRFPTPLLNSVFAVKYSINRAYNRNKPPEYYEEAAVFDKVTLYENTKVLPLGFVVDKNILDYDPYSVMKTAKRTQNDFAKALAGIEGNLLLGAIKSDGSAYTRNCSVELSDDGISGTYEVSPTIKTTDHIYVYLRFKIPANRSTFLTLNIDNLRGVYVKINGENISGIQINTQNEIIGLGKLEAGDEVVLGLFFQNPLKPESAYVERTLDETKSQNPLFLLGLYDREREAVVASRESGTFFVDLFQMDEERYLETIDELSRSPFEVTHYDDTHVEGFVNAGRGGVMFTTIPYDKRWHVYVDGAEVATEKVAEAFLAFSVRAGRHDIRLEFRVYGLAESFAVSGIALFATFFGETIIRLPGGRKRRGRGGKSESPVTPVEEFKGRDEIAEADEIEDLRDPTGWPEPADGAYGDDGAEFTDTAEELPYTAEYIVGAEESETEEGGPLEE